MLQYTHLTIISLILISLTTGCSKIFEPVDENCLVGSWINQTYVDEGDIGSVFILRVNITKDDYGIYHMEKWVRSDSGIHYWDHTTETGAQNSDITLHFPWTDTDSDRHLMIKYYSDGQMEIITSYEYYEDPFNVESGISEFFDREA